MSITGPNAEHDRRFLTVFCGLELTGNVIGGLLGFFLPTPMVGYLVTGAAVPDDHTAALVFLQRSAGFMYILFGGMIYLLFFRMVPTPEFKHAYFRWVGSVGILYIAAVCLLITESKTWVPLAAPLLAIGILLTSGRAYWLFRYGRTA